MGPPRLISIDEARERVLAALPRLPAERVPVEEALGRTLAGDAVAAADIPHFDPSAMDGFAVPAGGEARLRIAGESRAGAPWTAAIEQGSTIRISTGAAVPHGTHAVVPVERVEENDGHVTVPSSEPGENIRRAGEDIRAGAVAVAAGSVLGPAELAMLASLGLAEASCARRPRVAILSTGDELAEPGTALGAGQIYGSNGIGLAAQARRAGAEVVERAHAPDDREMIAAALGRMLGTSDVVCVSGGVSVGPHDHVKPALAGLEVQERFWGVRLQPGKPTWFGTRGGTLVFGLPGNPVSALVCFQLFAVPALRALQGADPSARRGSARLAGPIRRNPGRDQMVRVALESDGEGWVASPTGAQQSHVLSSLLGADALARIPAGEGELAAGDRVDIELL